MRENMLFIIFWIVLFIWLLLAFYLWKLYKKNSIKKKFFERGLDMFESINMIEFMEYLENLKHLYEKELKSSMHYVLIIRNLAKLEVINEIEQKIKEVNK